MIIRKKRVSDKLYFLHFQNQREMAETFLRFQEFYESPKFKGKIFTLENYKDWYRKIKGKFSYYSDWDGFNLPSKILKPFYDGKFNPLSDKEKQLLSIFKKMKGNYYIVAVAGKNTNINTL